MFQDVFRKILVDVGNDISVNMGKADQKKVNGNRVDFFWKYRQRNAFLLTILKPHPIS